MVGVSGISAWRTSANVASVRILGTGTADVEHRTVDLADLSATMACGSPRNGTLSMSIRGDRELGDCQMGRRGDATKAVRDSTRLRFRGRDQIAQRLVRAVGRTAKTYCTAKIWHNGIRFSGL